MKDRMACFIWCEECCERHWEPMNRLDEAGRVVSKSGTLKADSHCDSCTKKLPAGEGATAFTIDGGTDYVPWEDVYLALDAEEVPESFEGGL
jgi:hypothetical protein